MRRLLVVSMALAGCGDNVAEELARDGARLQLSWYEYADGTRQLAPGTMFDAERHEPCDVVTWDDRVAYCTPPAHEVEYTDASCTAPIARLHEPLDDTRYFRRTAVIGGAPVTAAVWERGAPIASPTNVYVATDDGRCLEETVTGTVFALGAELSRAALVRIDRAELPARGRFAAVVDTSEDGLRRPSGLRDHLLGFDCDVPAGANRDGVTCAPRDAGYTMYFENRECTAPVLVLPASAPVPRHAEMYGSFGCSTYHEVGAARTGLVYRQFETCIAVDVTPSVVYTLGEPLLLGVVPRVREDDGRRLHRYRLGDTGVAVPELYDPELDADCTAAGGDRCVPAAVGASQVFKDSICHDPELVALVPQQTCAYTPSHAVGTPVGGAGLSYFEIGALSGPVFTMADTCEPMAGSRYAVHDLGAALSPSTFVTAKLVPER